MSQRVRVMDGVAVEIIPEAVEVDGRAVPLAERYHPDFVAALLPCPAEVRPGWRLVDGAWEPPA